MEYSLIQNYQSLTKQDRCYDVEYDDDGLKVMMMMADVLIWWWEKERLAPPPQLLARSATLIVKKSLQSCLFAKQDNFYQLLIGVKHPGPHEPCRPGRSDLQGMLSI